MRDTRVATAADVLHHPSLPNSEGENLPRAPLRRTRALGQFYFGGHAVRWVSFKQALTRLRAARQHRVLILASVSLKSQSRQRANRVAHCRARSGIAFHA